MEAAKERGFHESPQLPDYRPGKPKGLHRQNHHREGVGLLLSSLEFSAMEMSLVTAMSREFALKEVLSQVWSRYDYILIDCMPSLGMITTNALAVAGTADGFNL